MKKGIPKSIYMRQAKDPSTQPHWATHWCPNAKRWFQRTPEEHERFKMERRDARARKREFKSGGNWKIEMRKLANYRLSDKWALIRQRILERDGHQCVICGKMDRLDVHHLHYDNVFQEKPEDLVALCAGERGCHRAIHYGNDGKRRRDWKSFNPRPVLPPAPTPAPPPLTDTMQ